ncbi:MAG TPA: carbon-nitrogen hydrolase family protein [Burkholderiaceae bacterium]|jgi:nitrilase|nr:carbon-nitrogen hydrolase family protein [Burkholderiaceae bacterium]
MSTATAVTVAAVQMVSKIDVGANLRDAAELIARAARAGARLVVLPEYFCIMGRSDRDKVAAREPDGQGPIQSFLSAAAAEHGIWLVGGTTPIDAQQPDRVKNSVLVYDPQGHRATRYDKIHLFAFSRGEESYDEARTIAPGRELSTFEFQAIGSPRIKVGLSVCYDLRFPELYRALAPVDLILVPSAFTATTGRAHWETLLRARAIENLCYVLAAAQGGRHENGRATYGHSMLIDPWGKVVSMQEEGPGVVVGTIDTQIIAQMRTDLPALSHRVIK